MRFPIVVGAIVVLVGSLSFADEKKEEKGKTVTKEAEVLAYDEATDEVTFKVGVKELKVKIVKGLHVHAEDGKLLKDKDLIKIVLKKGVKVDLEFDGDKLEEIQVKKAK